MANTNAYYLLGGMAGGLALGVGVSALWRGASSVKEGSVDKRPDGAYGADGSLITPGDNRVSDALNKAFSPSIEGLKNSMAIDDAKTKENTVWKPTAPPAGAGRKRRRTKRSKRHGRKKSSRR